MTKQVKTVVHLLDDLDGSKAEATIEFAIDGQKYEIDLSARHRRQFDKALKPFIEAARVDGNTRSASGRRGGPSEAELREWARSQGIAVAPKGRVPNAIKQAYAKRHR